jgi:hypothetical protein
VRNLSEPVIAAKLFNARTLLNEAHVDYLARYNKIVATFGATLSALSMENDIFKPVFSVRGNNLSLISKIIFVC